MMQLIQLDSITVQQKESKNKKQGQEREKEVRPSNSQEKHC